MGMRPTLYHFYAGTSFRTGPYHLLSSFLSAFVYSPSLQETECLFGNFLLSFTLSMTAKGRKVGGASPQERGAKGSCTTHGFGRGNKQSSFAFFLDDKYVR